MITTGLTIAIENSTITDMKKIQELYEEARAYQRIRESVIWGEFTHELVEKEIQEKRQWKLIIDNEIACVWMTVFTDEEIWDQTHEQSAVYIHRIATNPVFRGKNLVAKLVEWAKGFAIEHGKKYVRLDTVGRNQGLIKHYTSCGFTFLGTTQLTSTKGLPSHYNLDVVCLFEYKIEP